MADNRIPWSKPAKIAFGTFMGLLVVVYVLNSLRFDQIGKKEFNSFYTTSINGAISCNPTGGSSGTYFCIEGNRYNFHPYKSDINENKIFSRFAEVGDSICKPAYSDTLVLIKQGKSYQYTFSKIE